jgi:hypothetical protein
MENNIQAPFTDLPEALVEDMLNMSEEIGTALFHSFREVHNNREKIRKRLENLNLLKKDTDLGYPNIPTSCGVDGSYAIERLLATDLIAAAAVAVEGLAPPSEERYWEKPNYLVFIQPEKHDQNTTSVIRGIMTAMELELASKTPHDITLLDGSLTTPLIYMNQAINKLKEISSKLLQDKLESVIPSFLSSYKLILASSRTDKIWVSLPKYTTKRELGAKLELPNNYDDRAILTNVLLPNEYTAPIRIEKPQQPWHIRLPDEFKRLNSERQELISSIDNIHVMYYRPHIWTPALRIEMSPTIASNNARIAILLHGLKYQSATPGIFEPYPIYMADRMVKHLGRAIPAFRQTATRRMAELFDGDIGEIFFSMHGYRTDAGW